MPAAGFAALGVQLLTTLTHNCPHPQVLGEWYKDGVDNKGILLMVTTSKEGAVTGGTKFVEVRGAPAGAVQY